MKVIIPIAGSGKVLRPHTLSQPKSLIPIAGKTVIGINIEHLYNAGIKDFIFIVGYLGDKVEEFVRHTYPHINALFVYQKERLGTAHAVLLAKPYINIGEKMLIVLGDSICEYDVNQLINSSDNLLGVKRVDNPQRFGVAMLDEFNNIIKVIEKPEIPKSNFALVGLYLINDTTMLFDVLTILTDEKNTTSKHYYYLTDAIEEMIQKHICFKAFKIKSWYDCGKKETILEVNSFLLNKFYKDEFKVHSFENTIIIPPVIIGEHCSICNSVIGPDVTIGNNTHINQSIVRKTIVGSFTNLQEVVLNDSIIGNDVVVQGLSRTLNIGDNTEIDFG